MGRFRRHFGNASIVHLGVPTKATVFVFVREAMWPPRRRKDTSKTPQDVPGRPLESTKKRPSHGQKGTRRPQNVSKRLRKAPGQRQKRFKQCPKRKKYGKFFDKQLPMFWEPLAAADGPQDGPKTPSRRLKTSQEGPRTTPKKGEAMSKKERNMKVLRQTITHILGALRTERMQFRRAWLLFCSECLRLHLAAAAGRFNLWVELSIRLRDKFLPGWPRGKCTRRSEALQEACSELPLPLGAGTV